MRDRLGLLAVLAAAVLWNGVTSLADAPARTPVVAQARPFVDFLTAIRAGDADGFRDAQCRQFRESGQPWARKLEEARGSLNQRYGDYDLAAFVYQFKGDVAQGELAVTYKDRHPIVLKVVKEGELWKLASH